MKKKVRTIILIILAVLIGYNIYSAYHNRRIKKETDAQLKQIFQPVINNTVFIIDGDKYILRINRAKLSDNAKQYVKEYRHEALVSFNIYKNEVNDENFIDEASLWLNISKKDGQYQTSYKDGFHSQRISNRGKIYSTVIDKYYDSLEDELEKIMDISILSSNGGGSYDEDNIEYDSNGKLIKSGTVHYINKYSNPYLSIIFEASFEMKNDNEYIEIPIDTQKVQGDFSVLWDLDAENIKSLGVVYRNNDKGEIKIDDRNKISHIVEYLKNMDFVFMENSNEIENEIVQIFIHDYWDPIFISISDNAVYITNSYKCSDKAAVDELLKILSTE